MSDTEPLFAGLKVIDCASCVAAPAAATVLADFGAESEKVPVSVAPGHGEHSSQILLEAGYSAAEIADLRAAGVVTGG